MFFSFLSFYLGLVASSVSVSTLHLNPNGFHWLGDSSECSSFVQLHQGALWAQPDNQQHSPPLACMHTFVYTWKEKKNLISTWQWWQKDETNRKHIISAFCRYLLCVCVCLCSLYFSLWHHKWLPNFAETFFVIIFLHAITCRWIRQIAYYVINTHVHAHTQKLCDQVNKTELWWVVSSRLPRESKLSVLLH